MNDLVSLDIDLTRYQRAAAQASGALTVVPLVGDDVPGRFAPPLTGLKLNRVKGYGNVEMQNAGAGVAIVPLHLGYVQDRAQNHALCRAAFIGPGQTVTFTDACCVQQGQGGYLTEAQQWFFVLPLSLRDTALTLRGKTGYQKLWAAIAQLNAKWKRGTVGHLEQIISRERGYLTQWVNRFELLPRQVGALFLLRGRLVGVEIAPTAEYFAETWMPLVCFAYGVEAMYHESIRGESQPRSPLEADSLPELRRALERRREAAERAADDAIAKAPADPFDVDEEDSYIDLKLFTMRSGSFSGQVVRRKDGLVYASLCARPERLQG